MINIKQTNSQKTKLFIKKLASVVMAAGIVMGIFSMGPVEAKWGAVTRYCSKSNVEFWEHCNGYGDDEPITYLSKGAKLKYYSTYYTGDPEQAYCQYVAWKRNGYMDVHYLSKTKKK